MRCGIHPEKSSPPHLSLLWNAFYLFGLDLSRDPLARIGVVVVVRKLPVPALTIQSKQLDGRWRSIVLRRTASMIAPNCWPKLCRHSSPSMSSFLACFLPFSSLHLCTRLCVCFCLKSLRSALRPQPENRKRYEARKGDVACGRRNPL